jgi:putative SOS response-associated peptidase YedK
MCNHYRLHPEDIADWAEWIGFNLPPPRADMDKNIWPKRDGLVARIEDGKRMIETMAWGVPMTIPGKRPGTTITKHVTNVRNLTSPFWRSMLKAPAQRCLVPFSAFAEPMIGHGREEHWFNVTDATVAAFAGIWRASDEGRVYAFLTCEPNPRVAPLHPKAMPVILQEDDYDQWMGGTYDEACALAVPYPSQLMNVA